MARVTQSGTDFFFYDMGGRLLAAYLWGNPSQPERAVYLAGQKLGRWADRLGSVRYASGVVNHYYPYGELVAGTSNTGFKFAETYRDDSGLDYAMARYYASSLGRFLSVDPGGVAAAEPTDPQSWNRYSYVQNDPADYSDPAGEFRLAAGVVCRSSQTVTGVRFGMTNEGVLVSTLLMGPRFRCYDLREELPEPPRTPPSVKRDFYQEYGKKFNDCIKSLFGSDAPGEQTLQNAPILDATKTQAQLTAMAGQPAIGWNTPTSGPNGRVYLASDYFQNSNDLWVFSAYAHELGNILDAKKNPNADREHYERTYGNPSDPIDTDTGMAVERCVFGGYVNRDGSITK